MTRPLGTYRGFELSIEGSGDDARGVARLRHTESETLSLELATSIGSEETNEIRIHELVDEWREDQGDDWEQGFMDA